jgi:hypothetical protein
MERKDCGHQRVRTGNRRRGFRRLLFSSLGFPCSLNSAATAQATHTSALKRRKYGPRSVPLETPGTIKQRTETGESVAGWLAVVLLRVHTHIIACSTRLQIVVCLDFDGSTALASHDAQHLERVGQVDFHVGFFFFSVLIPFPYEKASTHPSRFACELRAARHHDPDFVPTSRFRLLLPRRHPCIEKGSTRLRTNNA